MPHAAEPQDEAPYEPAQCDPAHYTEQALLGALLLTPQLLRTTAGLEPDSFANPAHGALLAAMRTVPAPKEQESQTGLTWLRAVLKEARQKAPALTAAYLHLLISACPRPEHAGAYAAMVHAEHARRSIRLHAETLAQAAQDDTVPDRPAHALAAANALARQLDVLSRDFPAHPGSLPRTPTPPSPPSPDVDEAQDQERMLLASALIWPATVKEMRWVAAEDFVHPVHSGLWQCVTALTHRGDPVDPITVMWEAQHRGVLAAGIAPSEVLTLLGDAAGSPDYWGTRIVERALLARARHTADRITAFTNDPANTVHQLLTGGRRALADLASVRRRWQQAVRPPPASPTPSKTRATPRAGPRSPLSVSQPHAHAAARPAAPRTP
ncbi:MULTISPECIES: DnaB-like helicase N-terminal domain-containing protein [Streptomyces]|uniref:Replicative DNA helicase n=2 Tax=Streptomyces TaxID=1883 RepID=A0A100Y6I1_9ACTN|nr:MULTISPECIES: DnaB-like helicase N-terminal domain-containing protein [Streptomyces]KUH38591.1 replicative DNA helicase [Streptomyces kanasensis]UUS33931.1 replicative DNA helicase [Streptomyces changanensis]